jgi:hypothetical protein
MPPPSAPACASITVTVCTPRVPPGALQMPPPLAPAVQCWTMASTRVSVPAFRRQPPSSPLVPLAMVIDCTVREPPDKTVNGRRVSPPDKVMVPPPSSAMVEVIDLGVVRVMVTSPLPQAKVIVPPAASASSRAASVQLSAVPMPTIASARADRTGASAPARHTAIRNRRRPACTTQGDCSRFERATSDVPSSAVFDRTNHAEAVALAGDNRIFRVHDTGSWSAHSDRRGRCLSAVSPASATTCSSICACSERGDQSMGLRLSDVRP